MKVDLFSKTGTKTEKKIDLPDYIFAYPVNEALIKQALRVYTMNQTQTNANTKGKAEVRGGGKKPWANNKISRARTSSLRNPIFSGGGVVFGPLSSKNMKRSLSKKMRKAAIFSTMSMKSADKSVVVFEGFDKKESYKTKDLKKVFDKLPLDGKVLFVINENDKALVKTVKGIQGVDPTLATTLNVYDVLNHDTVLVTIEAVEGMQAIWKEGGKMKKEVKTTKEAPKSVASSKKTKKEEVNYLSTLNLSESMMKKFVDAGVDSKEKMKEVLSGEIKVAGVGEKTLDTLKKEIK